MTADGASEQKSEKGQRVAIVYGPAFNLNQTLLKMDVLFSEFESQISPHLKKSNLKFLPLDVTLTLRCNPEIFQQHDILFSYIRSVSAR